MKFLKYIFLFLFVVIIGTAIYIATLNGDYDVKRTRTIKAPAEVVFNTVNDFKNWQHWGPWYEMDSTIVASYPEVTSGVGASYTWTGAEGSGSMKTLSIIPNKEIIQEIDFETGSTPLVYWLFNEVEDGVELTWGMKGTNTFGEKAYFLTQGGIEKSMAPMYDQGLELLEQYLLKELEKHTIESKGIVDYGGGYYLYQTTSSSIDEIDNQMAKMFPAIMQYMEKHAIKASGSPFTINHKWDEKNKSTIFSTCIPIKERIITTDDVLTGFLKPQKTFKTVLTGDYKFLYNAWDSAYKTMKAQGLSEIKGGEPFEIYSVSPHNEANPAKWVTEIYIPIE